MIKYASYPNHNYANPFSNYYLIMIVQTLKKISKKKFKKIQLQDISLGMQAHHNREAVIMCTLHLVKRPS